MSFQIKWSLIAKGLKFLVIVTILALLGYGGYLAYYFATNQPYEVRVTNVTGSSATVSWYTKRKDMGVVAYKENNSFVTPISWFGSTLAYDDRDVALAIQENVDKVLGKSVKDLDAQNQVEYTQSDLENVRVSKKGNYYVHHVTVTNLKENSEYFFRVGNGIFWWNINKNLQAYDTQLEAPTVSNYSFKTFPEPESIPAPNTAYGKVLSTARNEDGFITENVSTDSIVYAKAIKSSNASQSQYLSTVTNNLGGWVIDKSNFRDDLGNIITNYAVGNDKLQTYVQFEYLSPEFKHELLWGVDDSPSYDYVVDNSATAPVLGSLLDKIKFSVNNTNLENNPVSRLILNSYAQVRCPYGTDRFGECLPPKTPTTPSAPATPSAPTTSTSNTNLTSAGYQPPAATSPSTTSGAVTCSGQHSKGCELTDMCYSKCTDGSYRNLGYTCRPATCATVRNGDYANGDYSQPRQVPKLDAEGKQVMINNSPVYVLCSTNTTDPRCNIDKPLYVTGGVICPSTQIAKLQSDGTYKCEETNTAGGESENKCTVRTNDCSGFQNLNLAGTACSAKQKERIDSCAKTEPCIITSPNGQGAKSIGTMTRSACLIYKNKNESSCNQTGQIPDGNGGCKCNTTIYVEQTAAGGGLLCVPKSLAPDSVVQQPPNNNCKVGDAVYNCGQKGYFKCNDSVLHYREGRDGCSEGNYCLFGGNANNQGMGVCVPKGFDIGVPNNLAETKNLFSEEESRAIGNILYDCYVKINSKAQVVDAQIVPNSSRQEVEEMFPEGPEGSWQKAFFDACTTQGNVGTGLNENKDKKISFVSKVGAQSSNTVETDGDYLIIFPESGIYDVQIGEEKFKNIYVNEDNKHFFYVEKNGIEGYQLPKNGKNPKDDEDELLPAAGAKITLYEKTDNQELKLSSGINIVSFNYVPARYEGKNMNARQLMRILNSSGVKVERITTFEGGKWAGGIAFDNSKNEIVGNDFLITPGRGYLIVANSSYSATVPGYGIKNSVPVALSNGWNLIGVNGFDKVYTASTLIDSINTIDGVSSNNVTWWPTSKGRYDTFQKSEGVEYGFDFPILKDIGYFVRVNEFDRKGDKSVIWNPGGQLHGEAGSTK